MATLICSEIVEYGGCSHTLEARDHMVLSGDMVGHIKTVHSSWYAQLTEDKKEFLSYIMMSRMQKTLVPTR